MKASNMQFEYDTYYQTENLFGEPYPELIAFYTAIKEKGKLLDLGCGQGRDAIPLAKLGFEVTGIDTSTVGIAQLNRIAQNEHLPLKGIVADIFEFSAFGEYDFVLLDSIFHFGKREQGREVQLLRRIINTAKPGARITICMQQTGNKLEILHSVLAAEPHIAIVHREELVYEFVDQGSNHRSQTAYEMLTLKH